MHNRKTLEEISILRPIIVFGIIVMHSFTKIHRAWGGQNNDSFIDWSWFSFSLDSFIVAAFVFVSGYLYSFQCLNGKRREFAEFARLKSKRLLLPYLLFGLLFFFSFRFFNQDFDWCTWIQSPWPFGHLWFLPMLFWVYLFLWGVEKYVLNRKAQLALLVALSLISMNPWSRNMPCSILGFSEVTYYIFYGYIGFEVYKKRESIKRFVSPILVFFTWMSFITVLFFYKTLLIPSADAGELISKIVCLPVQQISACLGIAATYLTCMLYHKSGLSATLANKLGKYCFAIYIIHYCVLLFLYDHHIGVGYIGIRVYPYVIGILTVTIVSLCLAFIMKKIKPLGNII